MKYYTFSLTVSLLAFMPLSGLAQQPVTPPIAPAGVPPVQATEIPPILNASEVLKPEILKGPHHTVQEAIPTAGFLNQYTLNSDFGDMPVKGNALLAKRIHEINAMAALDQIQKSDEFKKSLKAAAKMPIQMVENLIDDPAATARQIGAGAKRFVHRAGEIFKRKGHKTKEEDNAFQSALGFSKEKRRICWELKVDPYTTNQALQKKLDDLAWATFAGSFTIRLGMMAIPGGAGTAISGVSTSSSIAESIRDNTPSDLSAKNRELLTAMGIHENLVIAFIDSPNLSPTQQTVIVQKLSKIKNAQGKEAFVSMCLSARSEADAIFFQRIVQLIQLYGQNKSPIVTIFNLYGLPAAYTQDQTLIIPLELDYGSWTAEGAKLAGAISTYQLPGKEIKQRQLVITGKLSPMAMAEMTKAGIQVVENVYNEGVYK